MKVRLHSRLGDRPSACLGSGSEREVAALPMLNCNHIRRGPKMVESVEQRGVVLLKVRDVGAVDEVCPRGRETSVGQRISIEAAPPAQGGDRRTLAGRQAVGVQIGLDERKNPWKVGQGDAPKWVGG